MRNFFKKGLFLLTLAMLPVTFWTPLKAAETIKEWTFDTDGDLQGWLQASTANAQVAGGVLSAMYRNQDPYIISPDFEIAPKPGQYIEIRMKTVTNGRGQIFYAADNEGPYHGFDEGKTVVWPIRSDGLWHIYRLFPSWANLPKIIRLRLDFASPIDSQINKEGFEIDYVKIVDIGFGSLPKVTPDWTFNEQTAGWSVENGTVEKCADGWKLKAFSEEGATAAELVSDYFAFDIGLADLWISVTMKQAGKGAAVLYLGSQVSGEGVVPIEAEPEADGFVTYNLSMGGVKNWKGRIFRLGIRGGTAGDEPIIQRIAIRKAPLGNPRLRIDDIGLENALNRTETPLPMTMLIKNLGGENAENVTLSFPNLPKNISVQCNGETIESGNVPLGSLEPFDTIGGVSDTAENIITLTAAEAYQGKIDYILTADNAQTRTGSFDADITPSLHLPKADYVPKPESIELQDPELEIGALYFPGWYSRAPWERIRPSQPIRKPVLGWYDESNPEVIDWQIKWAKEAGISFFLVDWYWNRGHISLDHWIRGFQKAKYKSQLKWAMMWANHNGRGSHSITDQEAATKYWIENYFNTPEYYTIDGKPVVMIWTPEGMDIDMRETAKEQLGRDPEKGEGVKILLDTSRRIAQEAGFPGIYFIAMKWPERSTEAADIEWLNRAGFDMTSIYHYMNPGRGIEDPHEFNFDLIVESSLPWWRARQKTGIMPFMPNLSTGWDDRPWNNDLVISDRTPEKFRKVCEDMKTFLGESNIKRICLAPLNEWGEGSYAEPNREFGFKMYEALRETFAKEPETGWPQYYGPADVGLGPYDFPVDRLTYQTEWKFDGKSTVWKAFMGFENETLADGVLSAHAVSDDPAFTCPVAKVKASDFTQCTVRMKLTADDGSTHDGKSQLFWGTLTTPVCEEQSVTTPVQIDGQFHDYTFTLSTSDHWRGKIVNFRLAPPNLSGVTTTIESVTLK